jgi:hypothetical protein
VADGKVAAEGSTNWSVAGEGQSVAGKIGGPGYKAQNNTQSIITDPDTRGIGCGAHDRARALGLSSVTTFGGPDDLND